MFLESSNHLNAQWKKAIGRIIAKVIFSSVNKQVLKEAKSSNDNKIPSMAQIAVQAIKVF
jgi:hypothetical protein